VAKVFSGRVWNYGVEPHFQFFSQSLKEIEKVIEKNEGRIDKKFKRRLEKEKKKLKIN